MGYKQLSSNQMEFIIKNYQTMNYKQISEAQGDYWHGNPLVYPNSSKTQLEKN